MATTERALYEYPTYPSVTVPSDRAINWNGWLRAWEVIDPATRFVLAELKPGARSGTWVMWAPRHVRENARYRGRARGYVLPAAEVRLHFPELLEHGRDSSD